MTSGIYKTEVVWGKETNFATWDEWTQALWAEESFVGALLQKLLFGISIAYWNVNQTAWGSTFDAPFFAMKMGEIVFIEENEDFITMSFRDVSFSIDKQKPRRDPHLSGVSRSPEAWARWFLEFELEIHRSNSCNAYCEEKHALKDCKRSLAAPAYLAKIEAINLATSSEARAHKNTLGR